MSKKLINKAIEEIEYFSGMYNKINGVFVSIKKVKLVDDLYYYDATVHYQMQGRTETYTSCSLSKEVVDKQVECAKLRQ